MDCLQGQSWTRSGRGCTETGNGSPDDSNNLCGNYSEFGGQYTLENEREDVQPGKMVYKRECRLNSSFRRGWDPWQLSVQRQQTLKFRGPWDQNRLYSSMYVSVYDGAQCPGFLAGPLFGTMGKQCHILCLLYTLINLHWHRISDVETRNNGGVLHACVLQS